jgi:NAD(P)H-hydrate epimerase
MGVSTASWPTTSDLVIDALIGYSLRGDPVGAAADLITWANDQAAPILALDTPSGLDLTTGAVGTPAVWATATLTLALPKAGLLNAPNVGELYLADISVPSLVYQRMGIAVPALFRQSSLLRIGP